MEKAEMFKSVEEFQAFGKEGFEAYVAAAAALTKGFQTIAAESADYSRKSFEKGTQTIEKVMAAKSVEKALELQQGYVKDAYESFLSQVTRFNELYAAALKEAYKPFETQVANVTGKNIK
jgi:phasin family protein